MGRQCWILPAKIGLVEKAPSRAVSGALSYSSFDWLVHRHRIPAEVAGCSLVAGGAAGQAQEAVGKGQKGTELVVVVEAGRWGCGRALAAVPGRVLWLTLDGGKAGAEITGVSCWADGPATGTTGGLC